MKKLILIIILTFFALFGFSQNIETFKIEESGITPVNKSENDGNITITQDILLRKAVKRHIEINEDKFPGWRVQIYFGSGQKAWGEAQNVKTKFISRYGNQHGAYIIYDAPYFRVRVGDFRTKVEALYFKSVVEATFPNIWVIQDNVNYPLETTEDLN